VCRLRQDAKGRSASRGLTPACHEPSAGGGEQLRGLTQVEPYSSSAGFMVKLCELEAKMHGLIYLIGLIVVILAILSFFGLR
jgi:hypothetical protein